MLTYEEETQLKEYCTADPQLALLIQHLKEDHRMTLSRISHEVRNPVTLINGFLQLTQSRYPQVRDYQTWAPVMENMHFLRQLLDELSDYNNSDLIQKEYLSLTHLLKELVDDCNLAMPKLEILFEKKTAIPSAYFDRTKLRAAILNLIRNAAEALSDTPEGKIVVSLSFDGSSFCIQVANNGPQIPEAYLTDLFTPFVTHKTGGSGLGLAIAANTAHRHDGTISVLSTPEETCFTLLLPFFSHS